MPACKTDVKPYMMMMMMSKTEPGITTQYSINFRGVQVISPRGHFALSYLALDFGHLTPRPRAR